MRGGGRDHVTRNAFSVTEPGRGSCDLMTKKTFLVTNVGKVTSDPMTQKAFLVTTPVKACITLFAVLILIFTSLTSCEPGKEEPVKPEEVAEPLISVGVLAPALPRLGTGEDQRSRWIELSRLLKADRARLYIQDEGNDLGKDLAALYAKGVALIVAEGERPYKTFLSESKARKDRFLLIDPGIHAYYDLNLRAERVEGLALVQYRMEEAAFLAGYVAANMTRTGAVGFVGGLNLPEVAKYEYGFRAGALYARRGTKVLVAYADSNRDGDKVAKLVDYLSKEGVDILFHQAQESGDEAVRAAAARGMRAIGSDRDQAYVARGSVITSAVKSRDAIIAAYARDLVAGRFTAGARTLGLAEGAVGLTDGSWAALGDELAGKVKAVMQEIILGKIEVPVDLTGLGKFLKAEGLGGE